MAAPPDTAYQLQATAEPFSYAVRAEEKELLAQSRPDTAGTSLFYVTDAGAQYLTAPRRFDTTATSLEAVYETTDGRRARLRITSQDHGGFRLSVAFEPSEGVLRVGETLAARPGEHFHGLTERVRGAGDGFVRDSSVAVSLGRRGERVEMKTHGTISLYSPFYLSSGAPPAGAGGYGLFVEGTWAGRFDMAQADSQRIRFSFEGPALSYHVFTGEHPERIMEQYTSVAGRPLVPPKWAFGHWRWRNNHYAVDSLYDGTPYRGPFNGQVYEDVMMMEKLGIPLSVYWVDRPWAVGSYGYSGFKWDRERLPQPEAMTRWLEERGVKLLLWIGPWVMGDMTYEALRKGYFLPSKSMARLGLKRAAQASDLDFLRSIKPDLKAWTRRMGTRDVRVAMLDHFGERVDEDDDAQMRTSRERLRGLIEQSDTARELRRFLPMRDYGRVLIDFTYPEATRWWQEAVGLVLDDGVDGFKLDRSEEIVPAARGVYAHDGRSLAELHNAYPVLYAKATYEVTRRYRGDDFVLLTRAGYPGSQQYTTFWSGDAEASWLGLRNTLIAGLRAGLLGYPLWGSDTGGYAGKPVRRELMARWLAMSAFSPVMEVGPTSDRAPWDMPTGPRYDAELIATWRTYARLHEHLQDYTARYAEEAHRAGHPIMRPLFYAYPDDERAWEVWDQYLYGEDYLIAPVIEEGATAHEVYLPEGKWIDYWNPEGDTLRGPTTAAIKTPLYKTPLFIKAESSQEVIGLEALYQRSLEKARDRPVLEDGSELNAQQRKTTSP